MKKNHRWKRKPDTKRAVYECINCECIKFRISKPRPMALVGGKTIFVYDQSWGYEPLNGDFTEIRPNCIKEANQ